MLRQIHDNATESITRLDKENHKVPGDLCAPPPMKVEINVASTLQIFTGIYGAFTGKWEYRDFMFTGFHLVLNYR